MKVFQTALSAGALAVEVVATLYLGFVGYFLAVWMIDDSEAVGWTTNDWYRAGLVRIAIGVGIAALFGLAVYLANAYLTRPLNRRWPRVRLIWAVVLTAAIAIAVTVGAVEFMITKPYM
jgi:hypothetical protein